MTTRTAGPSPGGPDPAGQGAHQESQAVSRAEGGAFEPPLRTEALNQSCPKDAAAALGMFRT